MLTIVSFIIFSTGLCTVALLGLSISDVFTEPLKRRSLRMKQRAVTAVRTADSAKTQPATLREQLLNAA